MKKLLVVLVLSLISPLSNAANEKLNAWRVIETAAETARQIEKENVSFENETQKENSSSQEIPFILEEKNRFALNLWGLSHHPRYGKRKWNECERRKPGRKYGLNECNWGIGLRYYHRDELLGGKQISEINVFKNSFRGYAVTMGTGVFYDVLKLGEFTISPGAFAMFAQYEHPKKKKDIYLAGILPGIIIYNSNGAAINLVAVPEVDKNKWPTGHIEVYGLYLSINLDSFFRKIK